MNSPSSAQPPLRKKRAFDNSSMDISNDDSSSLYGLSDAEAETVKKFITNDLKLFTEDLYSLHTKLRIATNAVKSLRTSLAQGTVPKSLVINLKSVSLPPEACKTEIDEINKVTKEFELHRGALVLKAREKLVFHAESSITTLCQQFSSKVEKTLVELFANCNPPFVIADVVKKILLTAQNTVTFKLNTDALIEAKKQEEFIRKKEALNQAKEQVMEFKSDSVLEIVTEQVKKIVPDLIAQCQSFLEKNIGKSGQTPGIPAASKTKKGKSANKTSPGKGQAALPGNGYLVKQASNPNRSHVANPTGASGLKSGHQGKKPSTTVFPGPQNFLLSTPVVSPIVTQQASSIVPHNAFSANAAVSSSVPSSHPLVGMLGGHNGVLQAQGTKKNKGSLKKTNKKGGQ